MKNNRTMKDFYITCFEPFKQLIINNWDNMQFRCELNDKVTEILNTDLFTVYDRVIINCYYDGWETIQIADELKWSVKQVDNKRLNVIQKMRRINNCKSVLEYLKSLKKECK